jgi:hypothetical protein
MGGLWLGTHSFWDAGQVPDCLGVLRAQSRFHPRFDMSSIRCPAPMFPSASRFAAYRRTPSRRLKPGASACYPG